MVIGASGAAGIPPPLAGGGSSAAHQARALDAVGKLVAVEVFVEPALGEELVGMGVAGGALDRLVARIEAADADVLAHRPAEQERILADQRDVPADRLGGDVAKVLAIDQDRARRDVVEPRYKGEDRRLAA